MVHNKVWLKLGFVAIVIFAFIFLVESVKACYLSNPSTFYQFCYGNTYCENDSDCGAGSVEASDWGVDLGGCDMGCEAGQLYSPTCTSTGCSCGLPEAKWKKTCYNGETCKVRWNWDCSGTFEGKWDASEGKCVQCNEQAQIKAMKCGEEIEESNRCESACGADEECDEISPLHSPSLPDFCGGSTLEVNRKCATWDCKYSSDKYVCEPANCGVSQSCGGTTYYCVYDGEKWVWSTTKPPDFCCSDANCSGYDPNTHLKLVCDCPDITKCSLQQDNNYQCKPLRKCEKNSDCAPGWCCTADPALSAECKDVIGSCVNEGNMRCNNRYLCDPPGWSNEKTVDEKQANNFLDLIFNFFQSLFIR